MSKTSEKLDKPSLKSVKLDINLTLKISNFRITFPEFRDHLILSFYTNDAL